MAQAVVDRQQAGSGVFAVLAAVSFCHLLNDLTVSLLPAIYPILKSAFDLSFGQIGLITLVLQGIASLLQPLVGLYTDRKPQPYSLTYGMGCTLIGICLLAYAPNYFVLLGGAALLGLGASIFHPEASRLARLASGGAHGMAQSLFQLGGSFGSSIGPLLAAFVILPRGQSSLVWFALVALLAMGILALLGNWYRNTGHAAPRARNSADPPRGRAQVAGAARDRGADCADLLEVLLSVEHHQLLHLLFDASLCAADGNGADLSVRLPGCGGRGHFHRRSDRRPFRPQGCHLGFDPRRAAIHPGAALCRACGDRGLSVLIGLILSSAFSAIVVYAQELMPGRVGMVSGLFFGVAFGMAGIGAAALGELADLTNIEFVYRVCSFLPLIGLLTALLPDIEGRSRPKAVAAR